MLGILKGHHRRIRRRITEEEILFSSTIERTRASDADEEDREWM